MSLFLASVPDLIKSALAASTMFVFQNLKLSFKKIRGINAFYKIINKTVQKSYKVKSESPLAPPHPPSLPTKEKLLGNKYYEPF